MVEFKKNPSKQVRQSLDVVPLQVLQVISQRKQAELVPSSENPLLQGQLLEVSDRLSVELQVTQSVLAAPLHVKQE